MGTAKLLILENQWGQQVRTFSVEGESLNIVYLKDNRRVEAFSSLDELDKNKVAYTLLTNFNVSSVSQAGVLLDGVGAVRLADTKILPSPIHELSEERDEAELTGYLKKSAAGHLAIVFLLMLGSWAWVYFTKKEEPQLVTIVLPHTETKVAPEKRPHVKVSEKKLKPTTRVAHHKIPQPLKTKAYKTNTAKAVDVQRVGALAALGGVRNGTKGYEGLDVNSMKAIRSAGTGNGGGGVGSAGRGGMKGYMTGNGMIAGSPGNGGRAESAGGYGTRGTGGGKAGYGKLNKVGGISAVSLPLDDEATVEGGLDRDQIIAVINSHQGQIVYCYERGLQAAPQINGRVAVDFVIGPSGRITTAKVAQSSLGSRFVENCMLEKMRTWQFPRPVGKVNVDVLYPFELTRVSSR
jgi:TonB family protein